MLNVIQEYGNHIDSNKLLRNLIKKKLHADQDPFWGFI